MSAAGRWLQREGFYGVPPSDPAPGGLWIWIWTGEKRGCCVFFCRHGIEKTLGGEFGILLAPAEPELQAGDGKDGEEKDAWEAFGNLQGKSCSQTPSNFRRV